MAIRANKKGDLIGDNGTTRAERIGFLDKLDRTIGIESQEVYPATRQLEEKNRL